MEHYTSKHGLIISASASERKKMGEAARKAKARREKLFGPSTKKYVPPYGKQDILDRLS